MWTHRRNLRECSRPYTVQLLVSLEELQEGSTKGLLRYCVAIS